MNKSRKIPEEVDQLLREIRINKNLPNKAGLLKYDFYATWDDFFMAFLPLFVFALGVFCYIIRGWKVSGIFPVILFLICSLLTTLLLVGYWRHRRGLFFILLTPKYLISTWGSIQYYEWKDISEVCIEAEANFHDRKVRIEDWPINKSVSSISIFQPHLKATIEGDNRKISFIYNDKKKSIDIPTGVNIQNIATFINLYWTKVNPGAKKKGVIYSL